jgi:hypothetical protein
VNAEARQARRTARRPTAGSRLAWLAGVVAFLLTGLSNTGCQAPEGGEGEQRKMQVTDIDGYVEVLGRRRDREQDLKLSTRDTESTETIFEENLKIGTEGYIYHPNFLEFMAAGLVGLTQRDYEEVVAGMPRSTRDDGEILEFDLSGHFLKRKEYPGLVYARQYRHLEPRLFQPSIETTTSNYGVLWQYISQKVPARLQIDHTELELDSIGSDEEQGQQRNTSFQFDIGYNFSAHNALSFYYRHERVSEKPFELAYYQDDVGLGHRWDFGDNHQHRLQSDVTYLEQRGTFDIQHFQWEEQLRLNHTEKLRSWFRWEFVDRLQGSIAAIEPIDERSYSLSGTLEHELYESLVTQITGYYQKQEFADGLNIDRYGGRASFNYRKKNRLGVLRASYQAGFDRQERSGSDQLVEVLDERHTFRDPDPVVLSGTQVDTSSIFITAEDRVTTYLRGRDYTIMRVGERLEIRRVPSGRIADGETVLVDYVFLIGSNFTMDTLTQNVELRHDFAFGLSPYYRLRWQDQSLSPSRATGALPEDITAHTFGVEYQLRTLRLGAEYEDYQSTISPFEAVRLRASYSHRFKIGATAGVGVRWSDVRRRRPVRRNTRLFTVEGYYEHPITANLSVESSLGYRIGTDTVSGDDEGFDFDVALDWTIRQTDIRISYELAQSEDDFSRGDSSMIFVHVRRRF